MQSMEKLARMDIELEFLCCPHFVPSLTKQFNLCTLKQKQNFCKSFKLLVGKTIRTLTFDLENCNTSILYMIPSHFY